MLVDINPEHPEPRKVQRAVEALRAGEVIAYPTDTVYGLGCDISNKKAVDRLYQIIHSSAVRLGFEYALKSERNWFDGKLRNITTHPAEILKYCSPFYVM